MREILFKAKRRDNGEWVEGCYYTYKNAKLHVIKDNKGNVYIIDINTLSEYIGLTDKNGIKMFENDIVTVDDEDEIFLIEYVIASAEFTLSSKYLIFDFENVCNIDCEVVGNGFDNPELL